MKCIVSLVALILVFGGCKSFFPDKVATVIRVKNNTSKRVYVQMSYNFPDTALLKNAPKPFSTIDPGATMPYEFPDEKIEEIVENSPGRKLVFFFLNWDTVNAYHWDTIRKRYNILARKDLTAEEIKLMGYTIEYR